MRKYRLVAKKGEGTFSEVLKAQNVKDGRYHAIKCMKSTFDNIEQVNNLREIQALRRLSPHEHVITLEEVLYDQPTGRLALVFELMDANLYELIRGRKQFLNPMLIKSYMWQLMKSLDHMHKKGIFHRDIKPENILIESGSDMGRGLKLADFGSCRGIYSKQPYTEYISTRWYRAPECLLTDGYYGPEMDLWGAGCVMFEITSLYPLFPGTNEIDQATKIHKVLGTPSREMVQKFKSKAKLNSLISFEFPYQKGVGIPGLIPHASSECIDLITKLLKYEAADRITAKEAMRHPYFRDIREFEKKAAHAVSNVTVVKEITKNSDLPDSKYNENDPTLKSQGQNNGITPDQMLSSQPKVLPNILDKGTGVLTGRVGVKHTTQHQNHQEKNSNVTYGKSYGGTAVAMSSLPPIALGASNSANNTINNKQVKPTWPIRRRKSKTGIIPIANAISSSNNSASMGAESFYTNHQIGSNTSSIKSSNTGGVGSGLTQQQAIQKSQLTRAYGGNPPSRTVTGVGVGTGALKLGVKIEGNSPTGPLKDLLLNSKKIAV